jgi:hypothetical protein
MKEGGGGDHVSVGVTLPRTRGIKPVARRNLFRRRPGKICNCSCGLPSFIVLLTVVVVQYFLEHRLLKESELVLKKTNCLNFSQDADQDEDLDANQDEDQDEDQDVDQDADQGADQDEDQDANQDEDQVSDDIFSWNSYSKNA